MNSDEINSILFRLPSTRRVFLGTYPIDKLPKKPDGPFALVINYDPHDEPGSHWVALYSDGKNAHFHDSYGLPPLRLRIAMFLDPMEYSATATRVQSKRSRACGYHAVAFIIKRAEGMSVKTFLNKFGKDYRANDVLVRRFVHQVGKWNGI